MVLAFDNYKLMCFVGSRLDMFALPQRSFAFGHLNLMQFNLLCGNICSHKKIISYTKRNLILSKKLCISPKNPKSVKKLLCTWLHGHL